MHNNLKRDQRLEVARGWIDRYTGTKRIRDYSKYFRVHSECAIQELLMLQVPLSMEELAEGRTGAGVKRRNAKLKRANLKGKKKSKSKKKRNVTSNDSYVEVPWQDETYFYIAGYTGWGLPYGITWEENERMNDLDSLFQSVPPEKESENFGIKNDVLVNT